MWKRGSRIVALLLLAAAPAAAAGLEERYSIDAEKLVVRNVIGEIRVEGHNERTFEVEVRVLGADATADRVDVDLREGDSATLTVVFPLDESKRYVYPQMEGERKAEFNIDKGYSSSWLKRLTGTRMVRVSRSGSGLELWADLTVRVPRGRSIEIRHGVGKIRAGELEARVLLDSHVGSIQAEGVTGDLSVDTGSGSVMIRRTDGEELNVDTGSGSVSIEQARASRLDVDTGSGGVEAREIDADAAGIDTGSGSVRLELTGMGHGHFDIDTGSGGITLELPPDASAEVRASTGSGGIDVDLSGDHRVRFVESDEAFFTVGGGAARVALDTGSGGIRVRQ